MASATVSDKEISQWTQMDRSGDGCQSHSRFIYRRGRMVWYSERRRSVIVTEISVWKPLGEERTTHIDIK